MTMTLGERFFAALQLKEVDRVPALSVTQTGTIDLMKASGAYWPEAHMNFEAMARLALAAYEAAGFEAVRVPFGMYAEAEALGCKVDYHKGRIDFTPTITEPLRDLSSLRVVEPHGTMMAMVVEAVKIVKGKVGDTVPVIAGVVGPFNLATFVYGMEQLIRDIIARPDNIRRVLDITWQVVVKYCDALVEAGADAVSMLEPTASTIGPKFFGELVLPYLKRVNGSIRCPTVLHICGNTISILHLMAESGSKGLSLDQKVNVKRAKEIVGGKVAIIGNVDPVAVLLDGKPEDVKNASYRILEEGVDILAPGCGISPQTPLANMKAMVEAAKEYSGKKT